MCGISGLISSEPVTANDVAKVENINSRLLHRGPDSEGFFRHQTLFCRCVGFL